MVYCPQGVPLLSAVICKEVLGSQGSAAQTCSHGADKWQAAKTRIRMKKTLTVLDTRIFRMLNSLTFAKLR